MSPAEGLALQLGPLQRVWAHQLSRPQRVWARQLCPPQVSIEPLMGDSRCRGWCVPPGKCWPAGPGLGAVRGACAPQY